MTQPEWTEEYQKALMKMHTEGNYHENDYQVRLTKYKNDLQNKFLNYLNRKYRVKSLDKNDATTGTYLKYLSFPSTTQITDNTSFILHETVKDLGVIYLVKRDKNLRDTMNDLVVNNNFANIIFGDFKKGIKEYKYVSTHKNNDLWDWYLLNNNREFTGGKRKQMLESLTRPQLLALVKKYQVTTCSLKDTKNVLVSKMRKWKENHNVRFVN
jgi:hypothetical protein